MPPLSAQEQDDEQGNNEAENGGAFCQGGAQQQVLADLAFSFRLAADGLRCLTGCNANADAGANAGQCCDAAPKATKLAIINYSFYNNVKVGKKTQVIPSFLS